MKDVVYSTDKCFSFDLLTDICFFFTSFFQKRFYISVYCDSSSIFVPSRNFTYTFSKAHLEMTVESTQKCENGKLTSIQQKKETETSCGICSWWDHWARRSKCLYNMNVEWVAAAHSATPRIKLLSVDCQLWHIILFARIVCASHNR